MYKSSRYIPITQDNQYSCVIACIQMILIKRNLKLLSQDKIGKYLGLIVPNKYKELVKFAKIGNKPSAGYGTQINKPKYSLNNFFRKNNYPLFETYYPLSKINNVSDFIKEQIKKDNDIIICLNYKILDKKYYNQGHTFIIDSIDKDNLILINPEYEAQKYKKVKLNKLIRAIKDHGEKNRGGFWIISKN
ncbi:MAG: hypothetical protein V1824_01795 [archaeon]